jgi:hypothetical protein
VSGVTRRKTGKHNKTSLSNIPYQPTDLYVSILFNIKHGIEVFIKTLSVFAYGEYEEGHDIKTLFSNVKDKISKLSLVPRQKGFYDDIAQDDIDIFFTNLPDIEKLILYFFELDFLKRKLMGDFVIKDTHNDVLRYPDNKASIRIDWGSVLITRVRLSDIKEILEKLDALYELLNKSGHLLAVLSR